MPAAGVLLAYEASSNSRIAKADRMGLPVTHAELDELLAMEGVPAEELGLPEDDGNREHKIEILHLSPKDWEDL